MRVTAFVLISMLSKTAKANGSLSTYAEGNKNALLSFSNRRNVATWSMIGDDIDGEDGDEHFGAYISLSGDGLRLAVGSQYKDINTGYVRVLEWSDDSSWSPLGDSIVGENAGDFSGRPALNYAGDRLAIGGPNYDGVALYAGHVRVFSLVDNTWVPLGSTLEGKEYIENFGVGLSFNDDGDRLAIGASGGGSSGTGVMDGAGLVRIYEYDGNDWAQMGADIEGESYGDASGTSVCLSGDGVRIAIGAYGNDEQHYNAGHVRVFDYNSGTNEWLQKGTDIDGETSGDYSGFDVSLSSNGQRLAVGAYANDGGDSIKDSGHVRVFELSGEAWQQLGDDIDGTEAGDLSGWSVSLTADGSRLAIGEYGHDGTFSGTEGNVGRVRIFDFDASTSSWVVTGTLVGESEGDRSGRSVILSDDGKRVAIGADRNSERGNHVGHVRVYEMTSSTAEDPFQSQNTPAPMQSTVTQSPTLKSDGTTQLFTTPQPVTSPPTIAPTKSPTAAPTKRVVVPVPTTQSPTLGPKEESLGAGEVSSIPDVIGAIIVSIVEPIVEFVFAFF